MSKPAQDAAEWVRVLSDAVQERYQALRTIRERVHRTCLAALTGMVVFAGWVVERTTPEDFVRRTLFFCIAVIVVLVLRLRFLRDLERGFRTQQRVAVRIEDELGLYRGIYPLEWKRAGAESAPGRFFASTYALLYAGLLVVAVALFFETAVQGFLVLLRR